MAYTINHMEDAQCYAVASRDLERAKAFAEKFGIPKAYGSYEELAKDPDVELIYIAVPHSHHYMYMKMCLEHGKPVLCEKAFTANAAQAKEILELSKEKGVFVGEAIWTRYMPSRKIIDDAIAAGKIGEVNFVTANLGYNIQHVRRLTAPELAGGALLDVGIYPLSFIAMILGDEVASITSSCVKTETGVDAQNAVILTYKNGKWPLPTAVCWDLQNSLALSTVPKGIWWRKISTMLTASAFMTMTENWWKPLICRNRLPVLKMKYVHL